jgi:hypothetical protein
LAVVLADNGIGLPVTNPAPCFDNGRTLLNGLAIRNDAAPVRLAIALLALLLTAQVLPQQAAQLLVGIDPLVHRFRADRGMTADLLETPLLL